MNSGSRATGQPTDLEFTRELRVIVEQYLRAVDSWESAYKRFYRVASRARAVTPDLEDAQAEYVRSRSELNKRIPRARRLCAKFEVRDPFPGLVRVELGLDSPQVRDASAVGRNERAAIAECLAELEALCVESEHIETGHIRPDSAADRKSILQRIIDFFV
jgi:hypothetical protein